MCGAVIDGLSEKVKEGISLLCFFFFLIAGAESFFGGGGRRFFWGEREKKFSCSKKIRC